MSTIIMDLCSYTRLGLTGYLVSRGVKKRGFILNKCNMTFGIFISVWVVPDIAAMTSSRHLGLTALRWGLPLLDQSIAINFFSSTSFLVSSSMSLICLVPWIIPSVRVLVFSIFASSSSLNALKFSTYCTISWLLSLT